jgi:hypothetical protein
VSSVPSALTILQCLTKQICHVVWRRAKRWSPGLVTVWERPKQQLWGLPTHETQRLGLHLCRWPENPGVLRQVALPSSSLAGLSLELLIRSGQVVCHTALMFLLGLCHSSAPSETSDYGPCPWVSFQFTCVPTSSPTFFLVTLLGPTVAGPLPVYGSH